MSNAVRQTEKAVIVSCIDTSKYLVGIEAGREPLLTNEAHRAS